MASSPLFAKSMTSTHRFCIMNLNIFLFTLLSSTYNMEIGRKERRFKDGSTQPPEELINSAGFFAANASERLDNLIGVRRYVILFDVALDSSLGYSVTKTTV